MLRLQKYLFRMLIFQRVFLQTVNAEVHEEVIYGENGNHFEKCNAEACKQGKNGGSTEDFVNMTAINVFRINFVYRCRDFAAPVHLLEARLPRVGFEVA